MANKKRTNRTSTASGPTPAGERAPRTATPAREPERKGGKPEGGGGDYLIPGGLAVAVVIALVVYVRMGSTTPPEPPAGNLNGDVSPTTPSTTEPSRPTPPSRPQPPQQGTRVEPEPTPVPPSPPGAGEPVSPTHPEPTTPDPRGGRFTLAQATEGMPAGTRLVADIQTNLGTFTCELMPDRAPTTTANFVGLARGRREFWDPVAGRWTARPFYDGSIFHRVIPDFMIQGGDILRSGHGDPGYEIPDENVSSHDEPGLLCMANHGPNTSGGQFFILEDPKPHLNGSYSVFGRCTPVSLVERIARVQRGASDRPTSPVLIQSVRIHR